MKERKSISNPAEIPNYELFVELPDGGAVRLLDQAPSMNTDAEVRNFAGARILPNHLCLKSKEASDMPAREEPGFGALIDPGSTDVKEASHL